MAQTLTRLLVHIVFSTKDRLPLIEPGREERLFAYFGGLCRSVDSPLLAAGGETDHVHLLVSQSKNLAIADLLLRIKRDSSSWMKEHRPDFYWQDGYGAFTIGESQVEAVRGYLARQKEHHARVSFQDEYRALLRKYGVEFDERYIWT